MFPSLQISILIKFLAMQMYKYVNDFALKLLCDIIVMASNVNERNANSLNVYVHKPNIECYHQLNMHGKILNGVHNNIHNAPSVEAFKYAYTKLKLKHRNTH